MSEKDQEKIKFHSEAVNKVTSLVEKNYHRRQINKIYFRLRGQDK